LYCLIFEQGNYLSRNFKIETFGYTLRQMEAWLTSHIAQLLAWLALPEHGLSTVFVISFISATLLPLGSEPAVFGLVKLNPDLFWWAIAVATLGNTLGGMVSWWMGYGAHHAVDLVRKAKQADDQPSSMSDKMNSRALKWLERLGPKACLLSWLPGVGDPLCAVAGWLKMPLLPCAAYMAIGKLIRYVVMTSLLMWVF
jgi:membrane protein YqaA with SNARE-associated domain